MSNTQKFMQSLSVLDQDRAAAMEYLHSQSSKTVIKIFDSCYQEAGDGEYLSDDERIKFVLIDLGYRTFVTDVVNRALEEEREENGNDK